jgi:hypothetical protein
MTTAPVANNCPACMYCALNSNVNLCAAGTWCPVGSTSSAGSGPCPAGFYCTGICRTSSCRVLRKLYVDCCGFITILLRLFACLACAAGSWTATCFSKVACSAGFFCPLGSSTDRQNPCSAGYFCPQGSSTATQNPCPIGSFCPPSSGSHTPCTLGSFCSTTGLSAVTGQCSAGFYCPAGSSSPTQLACAAGYYCVSGSVFTIRGAIDGQGLVLSNILLYDRVSFRDC